MPNPLGLPSQWNSLEDQERLTALTNVVKTTNDLAQELADLRWGDVDFPDDLGDYATFLIHDTRSDTLLLSFYVEKGELDSRTWRKMYDCLHWIRHLQVLLELLELRSYT